MPLLFSYLLRLFLVGMVQLIALFCGLFFLIDGVENIRRFSLKEHFTWGEMLLMMMLQLPDFITLLLPSITLLTVLMTLSRLSRQNEITVMRASGVSIHRILIPFLLGGLLIASGQLVMQDRLVPWAKRAAQTLEDRFLGHENPAHADMDDVWLKSDQMLIHVHQVIPAERVMLDVAVFEWDDSERLHSHIQARSAKMHDGQWQLFHGILYRYGEGSVTAEKFAQRPWPITLTPEQLNRTAVNPDFLPFAQIQRLIERTEREGYDATRLRVLLHSRIALPTTTLAAIVLAFPFTLRLPRRGGVTRSLLLGLLIGFLMFVVADLSQALGMGGRLPPMLAAWAPVLFFAGIGGFLFLHLADPKRQG